MTSDEELERSGVRVAERLAVWGCPGPDPEAADRWGRHGPSAGLTHSHDLVIGVPRHLEQLG